jgi:L-alanine-DL-glutamate epimerase-like enolase superfamily enzyme
MRIRDVEVFLLPTGTILVRVVTEDGASGLGECSPMHGRIIARFVRDVLRPRLLGEDALNREALWAALFYPTYKLGVQGIQPEGIAGVDIALWDLAGRAAGQPLWQLLGGGFRTGFALYASIGGGADAPQEEMLRRVERAVSQGFRAIKLRMDWRVDRQDIAPERDLALFRAARQLVGEEFALSFDANNGYSVSTAIRQGRRLEDLGIRHFEEPVAQHDYAGIAAVARALDVPVSAGEHEYTLWQFRDLVVHSGVDLVQPDVVKCAGITEMRRILALAAAFNRPALPHQTQPVVGMLASLHLMATLPCVTLPQEYTGPRPELERFFANPPEFRAGRMRLPDAPGLGVDVIEEEIAPYRVE